MTRYIDADALIEEIARLANRSMVGEIDEPYLDWKTVVSKIYDAPTADVVPKSEVAKEFTCFVGDPHRVEHCPYLDEIEKAKTDVAREIFEEIEEQIDRSLSVITKILNSKSGRANGKTVLLSKYDVFIEAKKYIAELKKKYTEEK